MIKQQKKKGGRKKYIACKLMFFVFLGPMGLGETLAIFFQRIFGFLLQIFKKQTFMNRTLQLFLVISILSL